MRIPTRFLIWSCVSALLLCAEGGLSAQRSASRAIEPAIQSLRASARDREVASLFAPTFYQALGNKPRNDYITNFDFDGDWRGDNNWGHADDKKFSQKAYIYYSVAETATHFFIHYAVFHPRDYKGGERKGAILSELIHEGAQRGGKYDPTGLAEETALAHENDMEGCLVVVAKNGNDLEHGRVVFVETLHHNLFSKYVTGETVPKAFEKVKLDSQRALLYVEPKGHGIEAYDGGEKQTAKKKFLIYKFAAKAEDPEKANEGSVGYELVPIQTTLWLKAQRKTAKATETISGMNDTYGEAHDYAQVTIAIVQNGGRIAKRKISVGEIGSAFLGNVGGHNMARPPWGWFDRNDADEPLGFWFFDPAKIIKRDFKLDDSFSTAYIRLPFWAVGQRG